MGIKSGFRFFDQLSNGELPQSGAVLKVPGVGRLFAWGPTKPDDNSAGYAPNCLFVDTNAVGADRFLVNVGTVVVCNFDALGALIGIEDGGGYLTGETVEAAFQEFFTGLAKPLLLSAGAAAAAVALRFGAGLTEGLEFKVIDEIVTVTNAVETNLTETVPAGAVIISSQGNMNTIVAGDGSGDNGLVKVGIGITATPNKYGLSADLLKNTKIDSIPDWAVLAGAATVCVKGTDAAGAAVTEKFVAGGLVRVRIIYLACNSLVDAA